MSFISEHIFPLEKGRIFQVGINNQKECDRVKKEALKVEGVKNVKFDLKVFPHQINVVTGKIVDVHIVSTAVQKAGFHMVSKGFWA